MGSHASIEIMKRRNFRCRGIHDLTLVFCSQLLIVVHLQHRGGIYPSFRLRSSFLISAAVLVFVMPVSMFCFSSAFIRFPRIIAELGRGSFTTAGIGTALAQPLGRRI